MKNLSDKKDFILICGISKKVSQGGNYKMILCNGPVVLTEDAGFCAGRPFNSHNGYNSSRSWA